MKTIRNFDLSGKKVIIRCDFNVPMQNGTIMDDTRIKKSLKTIQYAIDHNAKVILLSHLGRIKESSDLEKNTLRPVAKRLQELLDLPVLFCEKTRGERLEKQVATLKDKEILLIENTRFEDFPSKKESGNDLELGKYWASLGDIFINDAFGTAHRSHASNVGIATYLPSGIGFLMEEELTALSSLETPEHPYIVILGGAKVKDKIGIIDALVKKADLILIGGAMAFTFLKAKGYFIGSSLLDEENIAFCTKIMEAYPSKIILPIDIIASRELSDSASIRVVSMDSLKKEDMGLDIGPQTIQLFKEKLVTAKTIVWNGPLGAYEYTNYQTGTKEILDYVTSLQANTILGGGDIVAAATKFHAQDKVSHCSTGGGATLEYLEGKTLPGIKAILERRNQNESE